MQTSSCSLSRAAERFERECARCHAASRSRRSSATSATRSFEDCVRLIRQPLTAGVGKSRCQPKDRIELVDQHSGRRRRGLTDLIERELGEAARAAPAAFHTRSWLPVSYQLPSSGGRSASVSSASASQSTHATPVNVSLIAGDSARIAISTTCAMPNFNILGERAMTADVNSTINRGLERADAVRRDDRCERLSVKARTGPGGTSVRQCVRRECGRDQRAVVNMLQKSALSTRHDGAGLSLAAESRRRRAPRRCPRQAR